MQQNIKLIFFVLILVYLKLAICEKFLNNNNDQNIDSDLSDFEFENHVDVSDNDKHQIESVNVQTTSSTTTTTASSKNIKNNNNNRKTTKKNPFIEKENKVRAALLKATQNTSMKRKFAEIIPILRTLSKQQRLVLAALISTQTSARAGQELTLNQVETMFGDRNTLILPILFDIANLVRMAASMLDNKTEPQLTRRQIANAQRNTLITKHTLLANGDGHTSGGQYTMPQAQYLKRSISHSDDDHEDSDDKIMADKIIEIITSNLKDDRHSIDEESTINIVSDNQTEIIDLDNKKSKRDRALLTSQLIEDSDVDSTEDGRSFHERKLNMTNFNGTNDQVAIESEDVLIGVTLLRSPNTQHLNDEQNNNINMTLEQHEALALGQLNGSLTSTNLTTKSLYDYDEYSSEELPNPEMLIRSGPGIHRYRNNKKPQNIFLTNGIGKDNFRNCDRFANLCIHVQDYPMQQIMGSIRRHKYAMGALLAEYSDKDEQVERDAYFENLKFNKKRREDESDDVDDDAQIPGGMCPSVVRYARPQKARSALGEWKYIVNTGTHTQTLRLEKCSKPNESCTYLTDNFKSRCIQIYNYHRLLSWDNQRGLHVDIFKVPTCCSCHIDSYRDKFPPLASYSSISPTISQIPSSYDQDFKYSPSNIRTLQQSNRYSTINLHDITNGNGEDDDTTDDSIAYQFGNGFKRIKPDNKFKYTGDNSLLLQSPSTLNLNYDNLNTYLLPTTIKPLISTSLRKTQIINPTLESYLSPPTSNGGDTNDHNSDGGIIGSGAGAGVGGGSSDSIINSNEYDFLSTFKQSNNGPTSLLTSNTLRKRQRRPVRKNISLQDDQNISGSEFIPDITSFTLSDGGEGGGGGGGGINIDRSSPSSSTRRMTTLKTNTTPITNNTTPQNTKTSSSTTSKTSSKIRTTGQTKSPRLPQLPSISTAPTSTLDLSKRVNYNYHPIIEFFSDSLKSKKQISDRVGINYGSSEESYWRPIVGDLT